jgi:hypothetical protein
MTKLKGFPKNRHERPAAICYNVVFDSGWVEQVDAKSAYEAKQKAQHLCGHYGFITNALPMGNTSTTPHD